MPQVDDYRIPDPLRELDRDELQARILDKAGEVTRLEQQLRDARQELNHLQLAFRAS